MEWFEKGKDFLKQIGYIRLVLLAVCGFFLIVVSVPQKESESEMTIQNSSAENRVNADENDIYVEKMEKRLADILQMIDGAGKVEVMITLASSAERILDKNEKTEESIETEQGEQQRQIQKITKEQETILAEENGEEVPYVIKKMEPVVEGVIVVMEGGGIESAAESVREAVQALFHLEEHKIKVLKMEVGS